MLRGRVSIHAPVWVRPRKLNEARLAHKVSIHAPVWVRLFLLVNLRFLNVFQFTHPCGCDRPSITIPIGIVGFNSRTRVGATTPLYVSNNKTIVSIHAPVWVRLFVPIMDIPCTMFQFTHPCGCDALLLIRRYLAPVSIHAPVWVRHPFNINPYRNSRFQFTHPCGCDGLTNTV